MFNSYYLMQNIPKQLEKFIQRGTIFIFSKSYCPYCDKAKQLFKIINVKYGSVEVDSDKSLKNDTEFIESLKQHSGIATYPKIYIGQKCIGGFSDLKDKYQTGHLYQLLKDENITYTHKL